MRLSESSNGHARASGNRPGWRTYLELGRVSNLPTVWTNVLAGVALSGALPSSTVLVAMIVAFSLFYVGGMSLNDAFDRHVDARERPERPIPSGRIPAREVFSIGGVLLLAGVVIIALAAPHRTAGVVGAVLLAGCIVLYDAWHKNNPLSPLIMGACRVLVYVTAALSVAGDVSRMVWIGSAALLAHLVALTALAKQERAGGWRVWWPMALLVVPVLIGAQLMTTQWAAFLPWLLYLIALGFGLGMLQSAGRAAVPAVVPMLIASIPLLDATLIAAAGESTWSALAIAGAPMTWRLQQWVRGT